MNLVLTSVLFASLASASSAQSAIVNPKLSGPMSTAVTSDVVDLSFSLDAARVAYTVVRSPEVLGSSGPTRLEVASSDGSGTPLVLTPEESNISSFRWTPDGARIVYTTAQSAGTIKVAPADGSAAPTVLYASGPSGDVAGHFASGHVRLTADGSRVVFLHRTGDYPHVYRLVSVPVTGGAPTLLNGTLAPDGDVLDFVVAGETVVYRADEVNGWTELYSVPADRSSPRINISHIAAGNQSVLAGYVVDPSGTRVVYLAGTVQRVFSVPVDGSAAAVVLSPTLPFSRDVTSFVVSPDATRVVYRGAPESNRAELFVVPIDGSAPAEPLVSFPDADVEEDYRFSPDGAYVVYHRFIGPYFSIRLSDGAIVQLYGSFALAWQLTPDSQRAVFLDFPREFYSARLDGTTPVVRINPDFAAAGFVDNTANDDGFAIRPDSQTVVFRADADSVGTLELYEVAIAPVGPPVATKLNPPVLPNGDAGAFLFAPSSTFVLYRAVLQTPGTFELFRAPEDVAINDPLPASSTGDANEFGVRNGRVVYRADQETNGRMELFGAAADGSAPAVKLNGPLNGGIVWSFDLSPNGSTALYTADTVGTFTRNLFSVPSDGSGAPVQLNPPLTASHSVGGFLVVPDGSQVVYEAEHEGTSGDRLYSVPIHGGTPVQLGVAPWAFEVKCTPDSSRVVFNTTGDLYSAPIDGSAAALDLSGFLTSISDFQLTPDGTRVVYMASRLSAIRLFSIPVQGGTRVELSGTLVSGGNVTGFALSADGERVVYLADRFVDERFILSSVLVDGGAGSIILNGPMVEPGTDVLDFQVSPVGADVVYLADQDVDEVEHLYRVPLDGSAPAVQLTGADLDDVSFAIAPDGANIVISLDGLQVLPMAGGSFVQISSSSFYTFTPDGRHVVLEESERLMLVPIDGGKSVRLSPDPVGSIRNFALDGERYVYRADQDAVDVIELYASWLQPVESTPLPPGRPVVR